MTCFVFPAVFLLLWSALASSLLAKIRSVLADCVLLFSNLRLADAILSQNSNTSSSFTDLFTLIHLNFFILHDGSFLTHCLYFGQELFKVARSKNSFSLFSDIVLGVVILSLGFSCFLSFSSSPNCSWQVLCCSGIAKNNVFFNKSRRRAGAGQVSVSGKMRIG